MTSQSYLISFANELKQYQDVLLRFEINSHSDLYQLLTRFRQVYLTPTISITGCYGVGLIDYIS